MPVNDQDHEEVLYGLIQEPREAAYYLNAALEDSDEMFLEALGDVASAHKMSTVARRAGIARPAMYRMLAKEGNPTFASLMSILRVLGLRFAIERDIIAPGRLAPSATATAITIGETTAKEKPEETISTNTDEALIGRIPISLLAQAQTPYGGHNYANT